MTDVLYQMTVGGAFVYVRENLGQRSVITHFFPWRPRNNGVAVYCAKLQEQFFALIMF